MRSFPLLEATHFFCREVVVARGALRRTVVAITGRKAA